MSGPDPMPSAPMPPAPWRIDPDDFVNNWIGAPFRWDGRSREGVDCWGLVWLWHRDCLGLALPDWIKGNRSRGWAHRIIAEEHAAHWHKLDKPEPHAIVLTLPAARPAHLGIFWRGGVLHADERAGVVWHALARFAARNPRYELGRYIGGAADG
jgi:hypothetical protein